MRISSECALQAAEEEKRLGGLSAVPVFPSKHPVLL
jgi:hypothetical protein